ncbi:DUF5050 domain-containing protein [Petroclostridium sp. X23]|uniref:DUF5050 domain-containing protein n=1 Tax=Petroclostridium sp. X23 TaxID=3045146 RepID=UPI0024AE2203|nr:DUF5050 domain-containing protein [Petroclostridium sp. X23]WHH57181.1 DUF5050 domain-containing protein [Petroclostridium sp. X23]
MSSKICSICGESNPDSYKFCTRCGIQLLDILEGSASTSQQDPNSKTLADDESAQQHNESHIELLNAPQTASTSKQLPNLRSKISITNNRIIDSMVIIAGVVVVVSIILATIFVLVVDKLGYNDTNRSIFITSPEQRKAREMNKLTNNLKGYWAGIRAIEKIELNEKELEECSTSVLTNKNNPIEFPFVFVINDDETLTFYSDTFLEGFRSKKIEISTHETIIKLSTTLEDAGNTYIELIGNLSSGNQILGGTYRILRNYGAIKEMSGRWKVNKIKSDKAFLDIHSKNVLTFPNKQKQLESWIDTVLFLSEGNEQQAVDKDSTRKQSEDLSLQLGVQELEVTANTQTGNTPGNIMNNGLVAKQGDWIYYCSDGEGLYKERIDGTNRVKLSDDWAEFINVAGDWIYYTAYSGRRGNSAFYMMKTDGSNRTEINNKAPRYFSIVNSTYYGIEGDTLRKGELGNTELPIDLGDGNIQYINIIEEWIYYTNTDDENKSYKMKTDGSKRIRLIDDSAKYLNVNDGWIYYINESDSNKLYKAQTDGSNKIKLSNDIVESINVSDNWIYYVNASDNYTLYKADINGSNRAKLNNDYSESINVVDNWIYYINGSDNYKLYKIKSDGSDNQAIK